MKQLTKWDLQYLNRAPSLTRNCICYNLEDKTFHIGNDSLYKAIKTKVGASRYSVIKFLYIPKNKYFIGFAQKM